MQCEICKEEIGEVIVNLPIKQSDGRLGTLACLSCAEKSGAYCKKHERPHLGFDDETHACIECIEELVIKEKDQAPEIYANLQQGLSEEEFQQLKKAAFIASGVSQSSQLRSIVRFIATKALREDIEFEEVIDRVLGEKSVDLILGV